MNFFKPATRPDIFPILKVTLLTFAVAAFVIPSILTASCLTGFSLFSHDFTVIRDRSIITSGNIGSNGFLELGHDALSQGNFSSGGNITLGDRASIHGNVIAGGDVILNSGASISGFIQQNAPIAYCEIPESEVVPGTQNINVWNGNTLSLVPGSYGDVRIYSNAKLILQSGNYQFRSLQLEPDGKIRFEISSGTVDVGVLSAFALADRVDFRGCLR